MNSTAAAGDLGLAAKPKEAPFHYRIARRVEEYGRLARFDRPIGTWLLLWPALWALWVAGGGQAGSKGTDRLRAGRGAHARRRLRHQRLRRPGHRSARQAHSGAAARRAPRVADRGPGAVRACSPRPRCGWSRRLNIFTVKLAVIGAALTVSYPFVKRFFPLPQLYLGISFGGWSVPMAFAAQRDSLPRIAWVLYIAAVVWAVLYDTIYAMVDREDDLTIGVKSSAILFADMDRLLIGVMQVMMLFALVLAGRDMGFGNWYYAGLVAAALLFLYQQWLIRAREPAACLRAFLNNNYVGMVIFIGVLLQYVYSR